MNDDRRTFVYVGNWDVRKVTPPNGFGICRFDCASGDLTEMQAAFPDISVGAACMNATRTILYCVDECTTLPGYFLGGGGQVYALAVDPRTGALREINHQPSYGSLPSHVAVDATGEFLIVTHHTDRTPITKVDRAPTGEYRIVLEYDDATTILFPLSSDGSIDGPCDVYRHSGDGGPLAKQTHPQIHSVKMSPSGRFFAVCDKGNDEILMFRINRTSRRLEVCGGKGFKSLPGSSPRYSAFHPYQPWLYVNHETRAVVSALRFDADGVLELIETVSSLPADVPDDLTRQQSDIAVHPSGRFLYSMIRGINAVTVFSIDSGNGGLKAIQTAILDGAGPRGCALSADGRFIIIAALASKEALVWAIGEDGKLCPTGRRIPQPNPGTVTFS